MLRQYGNFPSHLLSFQRGLFGFPTLRIMNLTNNNNNSGYILFSAALDTGHA